MSYIVRELKPCPFCGRIWMSVDLHPDGNFSTSCMCGAAGPKKENKTEAIKAWNTRDQHLLWNPFRLSIRFPKDVLSVDFKGELDSVDLPTILQMLSSRGKSGILHVSQGHLKSVICFKNGNIIAASDTNGLRLGQILFKHGMISQKRLNYALKLSKKTKKMLGEVLLFMGYVDQDTLRDVVQQQVQEAVLELFFWRKGHFEYRDCQMDFDERGAKQINTMEIIMEAARRMDEWEELKQKKAKVPPLIAELKKKRNPPVITPLKDRQKKPVRVAEQQKKIAEQQKKKENLPRLGGPRPRNERPPKASGLKPQDKSFSNVTELKQRKRAPMPRVIPYPEEKKQ
ncbi:MAG: DUF4388 domain-containing protein [Desulfobacterales bacterium]|nr:DUF4388 domain-containing protein [Desulfobacterales bacterium]